MPLRTSGIAQRDVAVLAAVAGSGAATGVLLAPAVRPGYVLYLDHVAVPDPARPTWQALTAPAGLRSWPLDAVVWAWSQALPGWLLQQCILVAAVLGAGLGAGVLLRRWGATASFAASVLAIANPYVVERLLLGQGTLLLGYASIPWIVVASRQRGRIRRLLLVTLASVPGALTPWGGVLVGAVAVAVTVVRRRRPGELVGQAAASSALCLVWLVPAVASGSGGADENGARAFALAGEPGVGMLVSALLGAGVWSSTAQVIRPGAPLIIAAVLFLMAIGVGARSVLRRSALQTGTLLGSFVLVPLVASLLSGPLLHWWSRGQSVPGVALFRDLHRSLAVSTFATVVLAAIGLAAIITTVSERRAAMMAPLALVLPISLSVMLVPDGPGRLHDAYRPIWFTNDWEPAMAAVGDDHGLVLSFPWQPLRRAEWVPGVFLDPTPKSLGARALVDTTLTVTRDGVTIGVADRSPQGPHAGTQAGGEGEREIDTLRRILTAGPGDPLPSGLLTSNGVAHVILWKDSPGLLPRLPDEWRRAFDGEHLEVWSDPGVTTR